ncbi:hypothetical protein N7470_007769 [Penicillium chermesinum]|nr:hypothetical protein N7470_007769 [Penicillium chermesinum]
MTRGLTFSTLDQSAEAFLSTTKVWQSDVLESSGDADEYLHWQERKWLMDLWNLGECKHIISGYLKCIKLNRGTNDEACRKLAKDYLACRMDKNLMAPDNFQNLGLVFKEDQPNDTSTSAASEKSDQDRKT